MSSKKSKTAPIYESKFRTWFFNKYTMAFFAFVLWVCFFDNNNLLEQHKMSRAIDKLEYEITDYQVKLEDIKEEEKDLADNIEKLAREKYKFGAPNEDIFVIEPKKNK